MPECHESTDYLRVLVCDDEESILKLYSEVLSPPDELIQSTQKLADLSSKLFESKNVLDSGCQMGPIELVLARQGKEAVQKVREAVSENDPFALVYMDKRLPPGPDGIWAAEQIRKLDPNVIIVIVTAFSDVEPEEIAKRVPPVDKLLYVQKPIQPHGIRQYLMSMGTKWVQEKELRKFHAQFGAQFGKKAVELYQVKDDLEKEKSRKYGMERVIYENELTFKTALEACSDVFYKYNLTSSSYEFFKGFPKRLIGFSPEMLLDMGPGGIRERVHADDMAHYERFIECLIDSTGKGQRCMSLQYRWKHKRDEYIELNETRVLMFDANNVPSYILGVIRGKSQYAEFDSLL